MGMPVSRRAMVAGSLGLVVAGPMAGVLAGCAALPPLSLDEAIRRLLRRSTERALARLCEPGGAWDRFVYDAALPQTYGPAGLVLERALMSDAFRERLDRTLRPIAARAARAAAPRITAAVRVIGVANARAVLAGGPHAATDLLRSDMGPAVLEAMLPEFRDGFRVLDDPLFGPIVAALAGIGGDAIARALTRHAEDAVWGAIGDEEAAIRADPTAGGDPQLAAILAGR